MFDPRPFPEDHTSSVDTCYPEMLRVRTDRIVGDHHVRRIKKKKKTLCIILLLPLQESDVNIITQQKA